MQDRPERDQELVEAVLAGDDEAFAALVGRHQQLVAGAAWRYGTRRDDIEDVVSEVFLKVYQNLHRYRPVHAFSTWLYRVAANHVMDRQRRSRREAVSSEVTESVAVQPATAAARLVSGERAALLREALAQLDPIYRKALYLVYIEGQRIDAAAHLLGVPSGTLKVRLMRGRRALGKILRQRHPGYFEEVTDAL